jgi:hypothetical protein
MMEVPENTAFRATTLLDIDMLTVHQPDADPLEATFELNDTLYAKANIPANTEEVYLWLGVS